MEQKHYNRTMFCNFDHFISNAFFRSKNFYSLNDSFGCRKLFKIIFRVVIREKFLFFFSNYPLSINVYSNCRRSEVLAEVPVSSIADKILFYVSKV